MRPALMSLTILAVVAGGSFAAPVARADPYRWCAEYSGRGGGGTNCGFVTLEQCMATVSGIGGFCRENLFYDGIPFGGEPARKRSPRRR
jgi:hypothetical protein